MTELHAPLDSLEWVDRDKLKANDYNPNKVSEDNLKLLVQSILTNGWTLPIVVRPDYTIIDGFHRWTVAGREPLKTMLGGKVPVVKVDHGFSWLKIRIYLTSSGKVVKKIYKRSVTRMRQKLKKLREKLIAGKLSFKDIYATWQSWRSYAMGFHAWRTIQTLGKLYNKLYIDTPLEMA